MLQESGAGSAMLSLVWILCAKTQLEQITHQTPGKGRRCEASEAYQSSKSVRSDMFSGILTKDRARWEQVMVGCV